VACPHTSFFVQVVGCNLSVRHFEILLLGAMPLPALSSLLHHRLYPHRHRVPLRTTICHAHLCTHPHLSKSHCHLSAIHPCVIKKQPTCPPTDQAAAETTPAHTRHTSHTFGIFLIPIAAITATITATTTDVFATHETPERANAPLRHAARSGFLRSTKASPLAMQV